MQLGHSLFVAWALAVWAAGAPLVAAAQPVSSAAHDLHVAVLRSTEGDATANEIDGALLRDLSVIAGIENPTVSPIDYAEIQLTVGCSDEGRQCLASIAQMVQVDAVVVRRLVVQPGHVALTLMYFDANASDEPSRVDQTFEGSDAGAQAATAIPALVRKLFGVPEPVVAASPAPVVVPQAPEVTVDPGRPSSHIDHDTPAKVGALTWITLAAGGGALAAGVVLGANAQSGFDNYKRLELQSTADVARANSKLDSVRSQALAADVLVPTGAVILALGGVLLALDLMRTETSPKLALLPVRGGAVLSMHATAEGL